MDVKNKALEAYKASIRLANASTETKNAALEKIAKALDARTADILKANKIDVANAEKLHKSGRLSKALVERLKLSESKIDGIIESVRSVARLDDPVGKVLARTELDRGLLLTKK